MPSEAAGPPFDPAAYGPAVAALLSVPRLPPLGPGTPSAADRAPVAAWAAAPDFGRPVRDPAAALACVAGLYLHFDCCDEAHAVAQALETPDRAFWHAILHRREPDAANAKYWFRRVGPHPVIERLAAESGYSTPTRFVDVCEQVRGTGSVAEERARRVQWLEWRLLFDHCARAAVGVR